MENLSIILIVIGLAVFVFSFWSFYLLKKHLRQFKGSYRHSSNLTDEKYYELKSKQEFIISISSIIFAILTLIGYNSISDIKKELAAQVQTEKNKLTSLSDTATHNLDSLKIMGKDFKDTVRSALNLVADLQSRINEINSKDVIKQNIFIVDPLVMRQFGKDKMGPEPEYRIIKFKDLVTISGQTLPAFKVSPSIICFSTTSSSIMVKDITTEGFKVRPEMYTINMATAKKGDEDGDNIVFSVWISQKPK